MLDNANEIPDPPKYIKTKFVRTFPIFPMSIPLPYSPYSPYPSFQAQCGAVRCDSCEVKSMLDRVVFRGDVLPFNDSMTVCLSASGLFRGVDDVWTCCLFALCFCCFCVCVCVCFGLLFGVCGLWQSCCMLVERSCKSPVVKSVAVRMSLWIFSLL